MPKPHQATLFDAVRARLPLFDDLPDGVVERLAAGGYGRGLLTASVRARLRKAGFADQAMLALASPADLMAVRKIGPLRVEAIRDHLLGELARLVPGARADHDREATDLRRIERLRAQPGARFGRAGETCADLASRSCDALRAELEIPAADFDRLVASLALALQPHRAPVLAPEDETAHAADATRTHAELLRERDREWDEAAPSADAPEHDAEKWNPVFRNHRASTKR